MSRRGRVTAPPRPGGGRFLDAAPAEQARRAHVAALHAQGLNISRIAEQVGSTRGTIRADLRALNEAAQ